MNEVTIKIIYLGESTYLGVWDRENGHIITSVSTGGSEEVARKRIIHNFKHKGWIATDRIGGAIPHNTVFNFKQYELKEI